MLGWGTPEKNIRMAFSKKGYEILAQQIPPSPMSKAQVLTD